MNYLAPLHLRKTKLAIIGLGYVGLPIALAFDKLFSVVGYDINEHKIACLIQGEDPSGEVSAAEMQKNNIQFSHSASDLTDVSIFIVTVPTPVDENYLPDLKHLQSASQLIGNHIKKGNLVVFESTVYPGCTREDCIPIIERYSGLQAGIDFKYGYSPERINPGDKVHTIDKIVKVVSGCDSEALEWVAELYSSIVHAGVYKAASIEVAEAAKVIENTQRDLNISFMNELSVIFHLMNIDTQEVIEAAKTKWNFLPFYPGLVGGHCVGVDPWYLLHRAVKLGYDPQVILSGRRVNDSMPAFIAKQLVQTLISNGTNPGQAKVLVLGVTFKENVADIRNSKVVELIKELKGYSIQVEVHDPLANAQETFDLYGLPLTDQPEGPYDAAVLAVAHEAFCKLNGDFFLELLTNKPIFFDIKSQFPELKNRCIYWRL